MDRNDAREPARSARRVVAYLAWLAESGPGRVERSRSNNHGTWHDVQTAAFAFVCGQPRKARED